MSLSPRDAKFRQYETLDTWQPRDCIAITQVDHVIIAKLKDGGFMNGIFIPVQFVVIDVLLWINKKRENSCFALT